MKNKKTVKQKIATLIWNTSESSGIGLGDLAPIVFGWMIGCKNKKRVK